MTALPTTAPSPEPFTRRDPAPGSAELLSCDKRAARVMRDGAALPARVAFGCLIQPEPGDRVLTSLADGTLWVLAVLDRPGTAPPRLWADGDLGIAAGGDIAVLAGGDLSLSAAATARTAAPEIELHAGTARFVLDELTQIGRRALNYVSSIRTMSEVIETFSGHILTRAKRASRFIAHADLLRAGDIDHRAEGTLQLHAQSGFITAETLVRVDADQIHMG